MNQFVLNLNEIYKNNIKLRYLKDNIFCMEEEVVIPRSF